MAYIPSYTGIGSRETPMDVLLLMVRLGRTLTDHGRQLWSGDAIGADYAFYVGARLSPRFAEIGARIFIPDDGYQNRYHNPELGFYNAKRFTDTYEAAQQIAYEARGGFWGLGDKGMALMTRNPFQILSETLQRRTGALYYWGIPQGKTEKVKGGTNCALQVAIRYGVKTRNNLFYQEVRERANAWLLMHEQPYPYPSAEALVQILESRRTLNPHF